MVYRKNWKAIAVSSAVSKSKISRTHRGVVSPLPLGVLHLLGVSVKREALGPHLFVLLRICLPQVEVHKEAEEEAHSSGGKEDAVALEVTRCVGCAIYEACDDTTEVTEA